MEGIYNLFNSFISLMKTFSFSDLLDISAVAFIIYQLIKLVRETRAGQLVKGIIIMVAAYFLSYHLRFKMLSGLLNNFFQFSFIAILVVFQPEIRRALEQIGRSKISTYLPNGTMSSEEEYKVKIRQCIDVVVDTCMLLSRTGTGALIVFERQTKLGDIINTGTIIEAKASIPLIGNIFFNKAPLHDGAMIIKDGVVYAAGCILPLTRNENISSELGTRHRASLGITEISDAVCVVVSEETGGVSLASNGVMVRNLEKEQLKKKLYTQILFEPSCSKGDINFMSSIKTRLKKRRRENQNEKNNKVKRHLL